MSIESLSKSPVLVLKECISKEFNEILEESRVQHLLLLLDRIYACYDTILKYPENCDISFYRKQIEKDTENFNKSLTALRDELYKESVRTLDLRKKSKRKPLAYSHCRGF